MPLSKICPSFTFDSHHLRNLAAVVPEAFADRQINWNMLRETIDEHLEDETQEHFGLFWPGKRDARLLATLPRKGTLVPQPGQGVGEDATHNLFIEGDNLEMLNYIFIQAVLTPLKLLGFLKLPSISSHFCSDFRHFHVRYVVFWCNFDNFVPF